jgi:hypothetical protein
MSFVNINGWSIPVRQGSASGKVDALGEFRRGPEGQPIITRRGQKVGYDFTTTPLPLDDARALCGLINGLGDVFSYDVDLWSGKGIGPQSGTAAITAGGRYNAGLVTAAGNLNYAARPGFMNPDEGTLACWINVTADMRTRSISIVQASGPNGVSSHRIRLFHWGSTPRWYMSVGLNGSNQREAFVSSSHSSTAADGWHHIAGTWNARDVRVFTNGVERHRNTADPVGRMPTSLSIVAVGHNGAGVDPLNGMMDDLVILPYTASAAQIAAMADAPRGTVAFPRLTVAGAAFHGVERRMVGEVDGFDYVQTAQGPMATVSFTLHEE